MYSFEYKVGLRIIGDATNFLIDPEFDFIALVWFFDRRSGGYIKSVIPKKTYLDSLIIEKFQGYNRVFLELDLINSFEYREKYD